MIPTSFERSVIEKWLREPQDNIPPTDETPAGWTIELCGFGLIAAAALTAEAIAKHRPARILLIGISGALKDSLAIGDAFMFHLVTCHGIGVGTCLGEFHQSADRLGWSQCEADSIAQRIGGSLPLSTTSQTITSTSQTQENQLVSVTCASANAEEAHRRSTLFPDAIAEDMEGFGVALACARANVPLTIIRGISNRAGDRDHSRWQVDQALRSAVNLAKPLLQKTEN